MTALTARPDLDTKTKRKQARQWLQEENRKYPEHMVQIPRRDWLLTAPAEVAEVWRSRTMICQVWRYDGTTRLSVNTTNLDVESGEFRDGITWEQLMEVKRQVGFGDAEAVEIYPADRYIVNVANMRHLWIPGYQMPFGWHKGEADR